MYRLSKTAVLSSDLIAKYVEKDTQQLARARKLNDYYIANHAITKRTMADATKPNHKVVNPYANYITDIMVGYFMGEPVTYTSEESAFLETLKAIYNYNDEGAENAELAKNASIYGVAYEEVYLDDEKNIRFAMIDSAGAIPIYDNTVEADLLFFIRYYDDEDILTGNKTTYVEVYSRSYKQLYKMNGGALSLVSEEVHQWNAVPIIIYQNNKEQLGDFEPVIPLIDAYDVMNSDSINDMDYFADAYLALYGLEGTESDDISAMKEQRVLLLPQEAKAEWLLKTQNDTYVENLKKRLNEDIHKFSKTPAMTDKDFAANASGVAMRYKLMGIENVTSKKERAFKKGLQRRIELICNILALLGDSYDYRAINLSFKRNIPANMVEVADVLTKIGSLLSKETQVSLLPMDLDYEAEKARLQAEQEAGYIDFNSEEEVTNGAQG